MSAADDHRKRQYSDLWSVVRCRHRVCILYRDGPIRRIEICSIHTKRCAIFNLLRQWQVSSAHNMTRRVSKTPLFVDIFGRDCKSRENNACVTNIICGIDNITGMGQDKSASSWAQYTQFVVRCILCRSITKV